MKTSIEWAAGCADGRQGHSMLARSVASNGYILVRVGKHHHLADVRGYAYEHRVVAERKLGRQLHKGEIVHHIDGCKANNDQANLEVVSSVAEHRAHHRTVLREVPLRMPHESNVAVQCKCGCGITLRRYDQHGRPRLYISGHNPQSSPTEDTILGLLKNGPLSRRAIIAASALNTHAVAVCLTKLKKKVQVVRLSHGVWGKA